MKTKISKKELDTARQLSNKEVEETLQKAVKTMEYVVHGKETQPKWGAKTAPFKKDNSPSPKELLDYMTDVLKNAQWGDIGIVDYSYDESKNSTRIKVKKYKVLADYKDCILVEILGAHFWFFKNVVFSSEYMDTLEIYINNGQEYRNVRRETCYTGIVITGEDITEILMDNFDYDK